MLQLIYCLFDLFGLWSLLVIRVGKRATQKDGMGSSDRVGVPSQIGSFFFILTSTSVNQGDQDKESSPNAT